MPTLADTTVEELRSALGAVEGKKPVLRLVAAIAFKHGVTQSALAEWFGVERKTIYNWLSRLEDGDLTEMARDENRPGRPPKLSPDEHQRLEDALHRSPREVGYDAPAWTTTLAGRYLEDVFDVEYSRPSCRRLMRGCGLHHRTAERANTEIDPPLTDEDEADLRRLGHVWLPDEPRGFVGSVSDDSERGR